MTGKKILEDALLYGAISGYNIQTPTAVSYINRALDIIVRDYDEAGSIDTEDYTIDNNNVSTWLDLPSDFLVERRIYFKGTPSTLAYASYEPNNYLIQNNKIRFDMVNNYTMEYVAIPSYMENIEREPNLNAIWHPAISYYVAYRVKGEVFGDEEGEKHKLYADFEAYCKKVAGRLNTRKRRRIVKAPHWG